MTKNELRSMKDRGPYDTSLESNFSMYDKMPYYMDISFCGKEFVGFISGNIIKYYHCNLIGNLEIALPN